MYVTGYRSVSRYKTSVPSFSLSSHGIATIAIDPESSESTSILLDLTASATAITKTLSTLIGPSSMMSSSREGGDIVQAWIKARNDARIIYGAGRVTWDERGRDSWRAYFAL